MAPNQSVSAHIGHCWLYRAVDVTRFCGVEIGDAVLENMHLALGVVGMKKVPRVVDGGIFKKCVNSQAVYPLSEQHGLEAQERR